MIRRTLYSRRGQVSLHMAVILLVGVLLLTAMLEVLHVYSVLGNIREKTNAAVLSVAATNVSEVFRGTRERVGSARRYTGYDWAHVVTTADVEHSLRASLGLSASGGVLTRAGRSRASYRILALHTQYVNAIDGNLNFTTTMMVEIPISIGGTVLPPITRRLEVRTTYEPKF